VVHINPQGEAPDSDREHLLALPAGEALPELLREAFGA